MGRGRGRKGSGKRGGREKGEGRGEGWEGKFRGRGGREGKGVGKREGEGKFRGARPPKCFFLEPRLMAPYTTGAGSTPAVFRR